MAEGIVLKLLRHAPDSFSWEQLEALSLVSKKIRIKVLDLLKIRSLFTYSRDKSLRYHKMVRLAAAAEGAFEPQWSMVYEATKPDQITIDGAACKLPDGILWASGETHISACETHIALSFYKSRSHGWRTNPYFCLWKRGEPLPLIHKSFPRGGLFPHIYGGRVYLFSGGSFQAEFIDLAKPTEFFHFRNLLGYDEENDPERPYLRGLYAVGGHYLTWYHIDARDPVDGEKIRWTHFELRDFEDTGVDYKFERGLNGPYCFFQDFVCSHRRNLVEVKNYRDENSHAQPFLTRTFPYWIQQMTLNDGVVIVRLSQNRGIKVWEPDLPVTGHKRKRCKED